MPGSGPASNRKARHGWSALTRFRGNSPGEALLPRRNRAEKIGSSAKQHRRCYSPQITAAILSASAVKDAPSSFAIRCRGQRIELLVSTIGSWRPSNNGEFKVAYWIDDQPAVEEQWAAFAGGRGAIFKGEVTRFLTPLREGGRLSIRVYDWQGPAHEATFQILELDFVRQKIAAVCKW